MSDLLKPSDEPFRALEDPLAPESETPVLTVDDLDASYEWLSGLTQSAVLGIVVHDFERLIWVNQAVEWITGYSREELLQQSPLSLVDPGAR